MIYRNALLAATAFVIAAGIAPASAEAADGVALHSGTLRAGPESDYPAVDHISNGENLAIFGCTDGYSWCDVEGDGNRGWFPASRIGFLRDGRRELLSDVGVAVGIGIVEYSVDDYWGAHYRNRPFFRQEDHWRGRAPGGHGPVEHGTVGGPPVVNGPVHPLVNNDTHPHLDQRHVTPTVHPHVTTTPHIQPHVNVTPHVNTTPHFNTAPHVNVAPHPAPACDGLKCH